MELFMSSMVVFFGIAYTILEKGHVGIDILSSKFSLNAEAAVSSIFSIISFFFFVSLAVVNFERAIGLFSTGEIARVSQIPIYPFLAILSLGSVSISLVLFINLLTSSRMVSKNAPGMIPNSCLIEIEKWEG